MDAAGQIALLYFVAKFHYGFEQTHIAGLGKVVEIRSMQHSGRLLRWQCEGFFQYPNFV